MINGFAFFYYVLSRLDKNIWFAISILLPLAIVTVVAVILSFSSYGKLISGALKAKKFIKVSGMITVENGSIFYDKCIKGLPAPFVTGYNAFISGDDIAHALPAETVIKPLFKGKRRLLLAAFDGVGIIILTLSLLAIILQGETVAMIMFAALAPLPLFIINRIIYINILYFYEYKARKAYSTLLSIINNEWAGSRRFIE
ncbi:MAG: hypothetical protein EOM87_04605 [Clostridia bacterium]|nr:hypothetical protein [Clostridia bacterium]